MTAYEEIATDLARSPQAVTAFGLPDVPFGAGNTQVVPHEWAAWILTAMRDAELAGQTPKPFSKWLAACVMANR